MPTFRADLRQIVPYRPGMPIDEVAREFGLSEIVKLASNESPLPPFPEVQQAIADAAATVHRYPDNRRHRLTRAMAGHLGVDPDRLLFGGGSNELMLVTALAVGGPGTSAVFADPSFGLYRIATRVAGAEPRPVVLDGAHRHDLEAMRAAVTDDTTVVYVCNPNNPTGTHVAAPDLYRFIDSVPERVLVVVDEAYIEFARAVDCASALPLAAERDNVVVARTFSKVYGLAGLRVGYMVGHPAIFTELRKVQLPFTVSTPAQVAAMEAIRHQDRLDDRVSLNAAAMKIFTEELAVRDIPFADSQTNFVYLRPPAASLDAALLRRGVIVRPQPEGWIRVTVGTDQENRRFFAALDDALEGA